MEVCMENQAKGAEAVHDFLRFRELVTPLVVEALFWLGVLGSLVFGVLFIVDGTAEYGGGATQIAIGVFMVLLGPVFARISCELIIVLFGIHRTLGEIRDAVRKPLNAVAQEPTAQQ